MVELIGNARKNAFEEIARGIIRSGEIRYSNDIIAGKSGAVIYKYTDGIESSNVSGKSLSYNGKKPENGTIIVNENGNIGIAIHNGEYCAIKTISSDEIIITKKPQKECNY
ncbi:MAG: hypothetical protein PHO63_04350 [Bacilli bacterium]|nr:hypothetical protein [Bacilli bacterium]MDD4808737.1 hypothetical protein [Bacilli bacterium]